MSDGAGLSTKGVVSSGGALTYRMRAFDATLVAMVYWSSPDVDALGVNYTGPGPLQDIVVQNKITKLVSTLPAVPEVHFMPEMWAQQNVAAGQTDVALSAAVSANFDTIKMIRAGSIVGIATRLTEAITAGNITITVTKNGIACALFVSHTSGTGSSTVQATGIDTYFPGDLIGVKITTSVGFLPVTADLEVWIDQVST